MSDWSQLPEELLLLISKNLEDHCFDVIHARSVCHSWRSTFPFPSCLLRTSYSRPSFTIEKIHLFLFRVRTPAATLPSHYFLGGIGRDDSKDHLELPSPLQCSVKVKIPDSDPTLINTLDCQIVSVGYQYRIICWDPKVCVGDNIHRRAVFLPLNKEKDGKDFVVFLRECISMLVLLSDEMTWERVKNIPDSQCRDLVIFRGRIYATFHNGDVFIFDPYSLQGTLLMPLESMCSSKYLISSGNDELFLVEKFYKCNANTYAGVIDFNRLTCRVSRLDEKDGKWVEVSDLGDRVLFIGYFGNVSCSAKDLPDGCGLSGNSILFTSEGNLTFAYKYGVHTGRAEDELNTWRYSTENRVLILNRTLVIALRVECEAENLALDT